MSRPIWGLGVIGHYLLGGGAQVVGTLPNFSLYIENEATN